MGDNDKALAALVDILGPALDQRKGRAMLAAGFKHDTGASPITAGYSHGPGGNLSFPGVDPAVFHTIMGAHSMLGQLATVPSLYTNPTYYTITGVQGDTGDEKTDVCDDAPVAGLLKSCLTTSVFGRYERATPEIEINRLGQRVDRADPMDLALIGEPLAENVFMVGPESVATPANLLVNETARKFWERNVSFHRQLSQQLWVANPVNNSAGGGYKEMTGFQQLVATGYVDAETGTTCPAVDSYIQNFNFQRLDLAGGGNAAVAALTDLYYQVKDRAIRTGMMPVRWVFAMRPQLFYSLTEIWPCSYLTYRCQLEGNERVNVDASDAVKFRDDMRAGKYLLIDGEKIQVITDDGIPEVSNTDNANVPSGCFGTDVYLIPMSVVGGRAVTFLEYFQYENPSIRDALGNMVLARIEGAFLTWPRQTNTCIQFQSKIEPRLLLRTPWLAARLRNVVYCPIQHTREAFPDDPYFTDGGRTSRSGPSFFNVWQANE